VGYYQMRAFCVQVQESVRRRKVRVMQKLRKKKSRPSSSRRPAFRQLRRYEQALPRGKGVQLIELRVDGKNLLLRGPWISSHTTRRGEKVRSY